MIRILRAFAWMRWRILMNALERGGTRDRLERFSVALEQLGPIVAVVLLVPTAVFFAGAGAYAGWALATGEPRPMVFEALRFLLMFVCALTVIGPFILPAADRASPVRFLLLPISRPTLYVAQTAAALSDPWILLAIPIVAAIVLGLAAGGAVLPALMAAAAGAALIAVLLGITALITNTVQLVVRDRRRGELVALVFLLFIPLIGLLPQMVASSRRPADRDRPREERVERRRRQPPAWWNTAQRTTSAVVPSEMYVRATRSAAAGEARNAFVPAITLVAVGTALHAVALLVFGRILDSPGVSTSRRSGGRSTAWGRRIPGMPPGVSAVALAQLRLALRTPRGRSTLLTPLVVFVMFAVMIVRGNAASREEFDFLMLSNGLSIAAFGAGISFLALLPLAMNQFAIDRSGLTLVFLSPLSDAELLLGKAIGNGLVAMGPAALCVAAGYLLFPGGRGALWLCIPLGLVAMYVLVAPLAALLSAVFPRAVDLNSIGHGSNAHAAASLLGMLAFAAAAAPPILIVAVATRILDSPALAPALLAAWCVIAAAVSWLLFIPVRRVLEARRENLSLAAT